MAAQPWGFVDLSADGVPALVTFYEASKVLRCSRSHVDNLVLRGDLHAVRVGERLKRITRAELERYLTNQDRRSYGLPPLLVPAEVEEARLRLVERDQSA